MPDLLLHCGGQRVSFDELGAFDLPKETATYKPVAHQDLVRLAIDRTRLELDYDGEFEWSHGVNKHGNQYFGIAKLPGIQLTDLHCLSIGLRNSYDKTMCGALCFGINCFICDNLSFVGSMITVMRKHTSNVMRDLRRMFIEALDNVKQDATVVATTVEGWTNTPMNTDEGYRMIGLMTGQGLLQPTISTQMFRNWRKQEQRTAWDLYNCATESIKSVTPVRALQTYSGVHEFFVDEVVAQAA